MINLKKLSYILHTYIAIGTYANALKCVRDCELRDNFPTGPVCHGRRRRCILFSYCPQSLSQHSTDVPATCRGSLLSWDQNLKMGPRGRRIPQFDAYSDRETAWKITKREMHRVLAILYAFISEQRTSHNNIML